MPIDLSSRDLKEQFLNQKQIRELFFSGVGGFNMKKTKKLTFSNKHVTIYCKVIYTIQYEKINIQWAPKVYPALKVYPPI